MRCTEKSNCITARILATECIRAPAIASFLFTEVANAAAIAPHGAELECFVIATFFVAPLCEDAFAVAALAEDRFATDFAATGGCFDLAVVPVCELFACARVAGARWIG
jgi:hypothetical protein